MQKHILPAGWHNWGKKDAEKTVFYAEFQSKGDGASSKERAPFSSQLKSIRGYEIETVLFGKDNWNPVKKGFQDTLYTYGKGCRQYYEDCYIEGTVDFIFGWSTAVFNRCHIHSKGIWVS